jgi:hypothetical protein
MAALEACKRMHPAGPPAIPTPAGKPPREESPIPITPRPIDRPEGEAPMRILPKPEAPTPPDAPLTPQEPARSPLPSPPTAPAPTPPATTVPEKPAEKPLVKPVDDLFETPAEPVEKTDPVTRSQAPAGKTLITLKVDPAGYTPATAPAKAAQSNRGIVRLSLSIPERSAPKAQAGTATVESR